MQARGQLLGLASKDPAIGMVRPNGLDDEPQYKLDIDWEKASALGLSIGNINDTLRRRLGLGLRQRVRRPQPRQASVPAGRRATRACCRRTSSRWYVRNGAGQMVPFSTFASAHWIVGSPKLERYNGTPALEFLGAPPPGRSTGEALAAMEAAVEEAAHGHRLRVDRSLLRGGTLGLAGAGAVRRLAPHRLPVPRGALRELVDPVLGHAGRAARRARHRRRDALARARQRRLLPGRPAHHHRTLGQERDPDRGVREGKLRARHACSSRPRSRPPASACARSS